ncbi:MAG: SIMPL domain-containing protein [Candidatus Pacearchaeota archaeon]|nr:SIMPL domain-containing protein [Candidatus Pacearchaeota archaeon]
MKKENSAIVITCIIAAVVLIVAIMFLSRSGSIIPSSGKTVSATGISNIKVMPDLVTVYFSIETKGNTSSEATKANNDIYDDLIEEIIIAGFEEEDVKTESFNVYPNTYWEKDKMKTEGYIANHQLRVELSSDEISEVSSVIDAGVEAGAGISYINFELTQESQNKYKAQALKQASEDAMIKADAIASGVGKKVGELVSIQTSDFGYYPWNVYTASSGGAYREEDAIIAKEAATNIQPGEEEVTASVTATFRLK